MIIKKSILTLFALAVGLSAQCAPPDLEWIKGVGDRSGSRSGAIFNVDDYGAKGNAIDTCTAAIQRAIDDCALKGGGRVTFSSGVYLTGALFIKEGVELNIPKGTVLTASQSIESYPVIDTRVAGIEMPWPSALLNILNVSHASIGGDGLICGNGKPFWERYWAMRGQYDPKGLRWIVDYDCMRPRGVLVSNSQDITVSDIVIFQTGFWALHILYSDHITVRNVTINNNIGGRGPSTDGIDIDSSKDILVEHCLVECNDDNFCLKAGRDADGLRVNRPCENIVIRDCTAGCGDGLFTCGSETSGSIRNIVACNLTAKGTKYGLRFKSAVNRGGVVEQIYLSNIRMTDVRDPLVVDLNWNPSYSYSKLPDGYSLSSVPPHWTKMLESVPADKGMPKFRAVHLDNIVATGAETCIKVTGNRQSTVDDFVLRNVSIEGRCAGVLEWAANWTVHNVQIVTTDTTTLKRSNVRNAELQQVVRNEQ